MSDSADNQDPLADLINRVRADVEIAYSPDVIAAMFDLMQDSATLGRYVVLFNALKTVPEFRATEFNRAIDRKRAASSSLIADPLDTATILVKLSEGAVGYFIGQGSEIVYADIGIDDHLETVPVQSRRFSHWLRMRYFDDYGHAPSRDAFKNALDTVEAGAFKRGVTLKVHVRVGHHEGKIYLDRGTPECDAIEIDANGWRLIDRAPIKFIRSPNAGVLPVPLPGGRIEDMKRFVNLYIEPEQRAKEKGSKPRVEDRDFKLAVAAVLGCFLTDAEFALTLFYGAHGSAKTTLMKRLCALIDPILNDPPGPPREDRDVMIIAQRSFIQVSDNVKFISTERSGTYCRLLSGGSVQGRALFTDADMFNLTASRPIMLTATTMVVTEEDLLDRTIIVRTGPAFDDDDDKRSLPRKPRAQIDREFAAAWPRLLGCVLDAVAYGLRNAEANPAESLPRLADLAVWTYRCEGGFGWLPGTILAAYKEAFDDAARDLAEFDPVAAATLAFMADQPEWEGTATELLHHLARKAPPRVTKLKEWPLNSAVLGRRLRTLGAVLYHNGLALRWNRTENTRLIALKRIVSPDYQNREAPSQSEAEPGHSAEPDEGFTGAMKL